MHLIYTHTITVSDTQCDRFDRLKPSALLSVMQDAAGGSSNSLGLSGEVLASHGVFWAVIRNRVEISRLPLHGETVTIETWPEPKTRVAFPRATVGYDAEGNVLFRARSLWVLMDLSTRAMVLPPKAGFDVPGMIRDMDLPNPPSLPAIESDDAALRSVGYTDLDRNGHMSNIRYLDWIMDLLPSSFHGSHNLSGFSVCYLNEAREGQQIRLIHSLTGDGTLQVEAKRTGEDPHRVFAVRADFVKLM
ncbi:MAG: acyl-[acyl-carrier-protein] thioesterase [Faecousia sp.]